MSKSRDETPDGSLPAERLHKLEELFMHLERTVHDLNQSVIDQNKELTALARELNRVTVMVKSIADAQASPTADPLDEKPPHY
jgi:uncharacterized coiled-coil protein SlyX